MNPSPLSRRAILGASLATAFVGLGGGVAWALDRFVIDHTEIENASTFGQSASTQATASSSGGTVSSTGYSSSTATLSISSKTSGSGSSALAWYVADLKVTDATVVRTAFAEDKYGTNIVANTSAIAQQFGAIWALNGDYYGFRESGIVIRNGVAFRDAGARQGLMLTRDGTMQLYDETATTAAKLVSAGAWQTWSFGPGIVNGGKQVPGIESVEIDTNVGNHSIQGNQPRTAIGMVDTNHFVFVAVDGRSLGYSNGVTLPQLAQLMTNLKCQVAYNLDGGGSTTMWFNGDLVNNPLGKGAERETSDIIYLAK